MILTFVSMVQQDDEDFKLYSIKVSDFHKMLKIKGRENYDRIHNMTKQLMSRTVEIKRENGGYLLINWTSHIEYIPGEARIEFSFDPKLKPYLLQLKRAFKSYRLENILSLNSYYSIRLYELLKKWQNVVNWETSLDNLKSLLGIYQKSYDLYGNFKNKILNPAMVELEEKTDINPSFVEIKEGRKITGVIFTVKANKKCAHTKNKESEIEIYNSANKSQSIYSKMNMEAQNFKITESVFSTINSIATKIYDKDKKDKELLNLVKLANLKAKTNPIGFMLHIVKDKQKLYNEGDDPSIELDLNIHIHTKEVIPDWFKEKNKKVNIEKTEEDLKRDKIKHDEIMEMLRKNS